jgi:hypothetical protein
LLSAVAVLATQAEMLLHSGLPLQQAVGAALDQTVLLCRPQQPVVLAVVVLVVQTTALVFLVRDTLAAQPPAQPLPLRAAEVAVALVAAPFPVVAVVLVATPLNLTEEMVALLRRSLVLLLQVAVAAGPTMTELALPVAITGQRQSVVGAAAD